MKKSDSISTLLPAFLKVQAKLSGIKVEQTGSNPAFGNSKYSTLDDIQKIIKPAASENGIAIISELVTTEQSIGVQVTLYEAKSGEYMKFDPVVFPSEQINRRANAVQNAGGIFTYAQRYALKAIFNISDPADDTDANLPQQQGGNYQNYNNYNGPRNQNKGYQSNYRKQSANYAGQQQQTQQRRKYTPEEQKQLDQSLENAGQVTQKAKAERAAQTEKATIIATQKQTEALIQKLVQLSGLGMKEVTQKVAEIACTIASYKDADDLKKARIELYAAQRLEKSLKK